MSSGGLTTKPGSPYLAARGSMPAFRRAMAAARPPVPPPAMITRTGIP